LPVAEPAARPSRFLLAVTTGPTAVLYQSSDSVRFAPVPGRTGGLKRALTGSTA
jgi:hypothetical protein